MNAVQFTGMKIFSTTLARDREQMGDNITRWLHDNPQLEMVDKIITQMHSDGTLSAISTQWFGSDLTQAPR